jgi:hypothetical protein
VDRNRNLGGTLPRTIFALAASLAVAASLLVTSVASASGSDRNRDRIPDRWEKQHHLSLTVKQTRRDQDRDGLNNLAEYRANTDPRDADSDDDGIGDEQENAGTVASFTGGVLTIKLAKGGTLSGLVTPDTEIECDGPATASSASGDDDHGDGDHQDGDHQDGDHQDGDHRGGVQGNDDDGDDDHGDDDQSSCDATALTVGRTVAEAELKAANGQAVFEKVELRS